MRPALRRALGVACAGLALGALAGLWAGSGANTVRAEVRTRQLETPDAVCARCHQAIYASYEKTGMARGSGLAKDGLIAGGFRHAESGVDYRVFAGEGGGVMSYARAAGSDKGTLEGERRLEYFVGSGHRGRTYLYEEGGQWFELPINFYTRRQAWGMAPAFDHAERMPDALPVDPNCLHCHTTGVGEVAATARNRFVEAPFTQGGVGCSACHGDGAAHVAAGGHGRIVNPGKLNVARRDSGCIQCHLEGDAVVYRPGRSLAQFRAGDDLTDFAVYFVKAQQAGGGGRATSQYEALLRSACKRAVGDKLTCTTCHDPHSTPAPAERVEYFRAKCMGCHTGAAMAAHHAEQRDCAVCHMPSRDTTDISHEQVTDHDIEARPATKMTLAEGAAELVPVGAFAADDRTLGLAYAQLAQRGDVAAGRQALELLTKASQAGADDVELEVRLGFLRQISGDAAGARVAYTKALGGDPYEAAALGNLATLDVGGGAGAGRTQEAVRLLERLVDADPSQTAAGLNLAFIECSLGRKPEARDLTRRLLIDNPDSGALREFMKSGSYGGARCMVDAPEK